MNARRNASVVVKPFRRSSRRRRRRADDTAAASRPACQADPTARMRLPNRRRPDAVHQYPLISVNVARVVRIFFQVLGKRSLLRLKVHLVSAMRTCKIGRAPRDHLPAVLRCSRSATNSQARPGVFQFRLAVMGSRSSSDVRRAIKKKGLRHGAIASSYRHYVASCVPLPKTRPPP
jgi:hypothetical protein